MLFYLFCILALLAFTGVFYAAQKGWGTRMAYSAIMVCIWSGLALWTGGYIG